MIDNKIFPGFKFYKWEDEKPEVLRLKRIYKTKNEATLYDENDKIVTLSIKDLEDNYRGIRSDGLITFCIVKMPDGSEDVIVGLQGYEKLATVENPGLPYAICRQLVQDIFSNMAQFGNLAHTNQMILGMSISQDTCPPNIPFESLLAADEIIYSKSVYVYLDDNIDTILKFINKNKYDKVLKSLKEKMNIESVSSSLKDLLLTNKFFYDFRSCFNIKEIPFHINDDDETLNDGNTVYLSKELNEDIVNTYVLKYSKEINLNDIVRDYILVSPIEDEQTRKNNVFIVGYDSNGPLKTTIEN